MFFNKYPHRRNFAFVDSYDAASETAAIGAETFGLSVEAYENDVYRVSMTSSKRWAKTRRVIDLTPPPPLQDKAPLFFANSNGEFVFTNPNGEVLLQSSPGEGVGVCGETSMFQFHVPSDARFYGMGEKTFGRLELSGLRAKFWNTDVWSDFHWTQWSEHPADPPYFSTPYLIIRLESGWVGLLLDNPYPAYMETPGREGVGEIFVEWQRTSAQVTLGNEGGEPTLWVLYGETLKDLTRKFQSLIGKMPLPPLWSLGYHQSRWGYAGETDLLALDAKLAQHRIPCDGLWLDIDYMDGYRLFTYGEGLFPNGAQATAKALRRNRRKMIPIIDPGLKQDPTYAAYADGAEKDVFCKGPEGDEFIGLVWPGETVFPDFTLERVRKWWAGHVGSFVKGAFWGCWIDMNDPSTGPVDPHGMRFNGGKEPHAAHRNQYALGMQKATFEGFLKAHRDKRPFILSRSGFTGTSRYSAIWTGDNVSNYAYLKMSIPTSVNLSLSGVPMNGPDVGGFGGDADEALMRDWIKAGFLFPFLRNHSMKGSREQEPWQFSNSLLRTYSRYVRLRYKLLPYLYELYAQQEAVGDPILRPTMYEYPCANGAATEESDQFFVGPSILQAPILDAKERSRTVRLPGIEPWFSGNGEWTTAGEHEVRPGKDETPLYFRPGSLVAMQRRLPRTNRVRLNKIEVHVFVQNGWKGDSTTQVRADDGESYGYRRGKQSITNVTLSSHGGRLELETTQVETGFGPIEIEFVLHDTFDKVTINGTQATLQPERGQFTGRPFTQYRLSI